RISRRNPRFLHCQSWQPSNKTRSEIVPESHYQKGAVSIAQRAVTLPQIVTAPFLACAGDGVLCVFFWTGRVFGWGRVNQMGGWVVVLEKEIRTEYKSTMTIGYEKQ
ncbi:MAG: hypothetical protein ACI4US_00160, partial [Muribaculaceae bacterium]